VLPANNNGDEHCSRGRRANRKYIRGDGVHEYSTVFNWCRITLASCSLRHHTFTTTATTRVGRDSRQERPPVVRLIHLQQHGGWSTRCVTWRTSSHRYDITLMTSAHSALVT